MDSYNAYKNHCHVLSFSTFIIAYAMEKSLLLASNPNIDNNIPLYGPLK